MPKYICEVRSEWCGCETTLEFEADNIVDAAFELDDLIYNHAIEMGWDYEEDEEISDLFWAGEIIEVK